MGTYLNPGMRRKEVRMSRYKPRIDEEKDILNSERFKRAGSIAHHNTSVAAHSLKTADAAWRISSWLNDHGFKVNRRDAVRASLLHDIGMTDEAIHESVSWKKAYTHPVRGASIARTEFGARDDQVNAISRHMWPVCVIPPKHVIGWVVLAADKCVSMQEYLGPVRKRIAGRRKHRDKR